MKKTKKDRLRNRIPNNYSFWYWTLKNSDEVNQFIIRGNQSQHESMTHVLLYMQRHDPEKFEEIKGKDILRRLEHGQR